MMFVIWRLILTLCRLGCPDINHPADIELIAERIGCRTLRKHAYAICSDFLNKNTKVRSFKSSQNIQKKECGSDCTVSINK